MVDAVTAERPSVVLVHGANHDGWCWTLVVDILARAGIRSHALDLPFDTFVGDCAAVESAVRAARRDGPVLLVGHSYAGLPISAVGACADALVYIAARMPQRDETPSALTDRWTHPSFQDAAIPTPDGRITLSTGAADVLYNTTDPSLAELASQRWRPMASRVPNHPVPDPAWLSTPNLYVVCTQDRTVRVDAQRRVAQWADDTIELDCDHSPFFSAPTQLAAILQLEVAAMCARRRVQPVGAPIPETLDN